MVAACRALERGRAHGLVDDPYADALAGERGYAILRKLPAPEIMCFGVAIRSHFLDGEVRHAVETLEVATVVSLGAGLDTRPWRLELPESLRWIEVDFDDMLDYKHAALARLQARPRCRLERMSADLNDAGARDRIWSAVGAAPALMLTEGLLMYLPEATVQALATEAAAQCGVRHWLIDVVSPAYARRVGMAAYRGIADVRAEDHINGARLLEILGATGWARERHCSYLTDLLRVARGRLQDMFANRPADAPPPPPPLPETDPTGVSMFGRTGE